MRMKFKKLTFHNKKPCHFSLILRYTEKAHETHSFLHPPLRTAF